MTCASRPRGRRPRRPAIRAEISGFGRYPRRSATRSTRSRVADVMLGSCRKASETVITDTPAARATDFIEELIDRFTLRLKQDSHCARRQVKIPLAHAP